MADTSEKSLLEKLERKLAEAKTLLEKKQAEARAARQTVQYIRSEISRLQRKVNNLTCWCCSCANRSDAHFGCVACHVRSDVQSWLDATSKKAVSHGYEYLCPPPGTPQCPGWVQGDPPTMDDLEV